MNARTIRRAAERQAAKLARKAQPPVAATNPTVATNPAVEPFVPLPTATVSPAKLAANQANAKLSCGPTTEIGKQISSKNALKTGLTGRTVLLPTDDLAAYETLLSAFMNDFNPATADERELTQSIVDCTWRMQRIMNLEFGIYTKGSLEFADAFPDLDPAARNQMIQVETFLKYEKSIRNLNTQEARLHRRLLKDTLALKHLQAERRQHQDQVQAYLAARAQNAAQTPQPPAPSEVGFVFSTDINPAENISSSQEIAAAAADLR